MTAATDVDRLPLADSPLGRTIAQTETDIWNDSCAVDELEYALSYGAVGATANPTIVVDVWGKDPTRWRSRIGALAAERPIATVDDLAWSVVEEMSIEGAKLLEPVFEAQAGRQGRLSMQTNPTFFRSPDRMVEQAVHFSGLAPNIIVKLPATRAGMEAIEEATYRGVSVNVTVSFTVAQAVASAEAIERGLRRRDAEGLPTDRMGPVVTLMMGRTEDWLRIVVDRDAVVVTRTRSVERRGRVQARVQDLPRARVPRSAPGSGDPASLPLVGAHRRGRRHHPAGALAAALQRLVDRGSAAHRRRGRSRDRRRADDAPAGVPVGL
jgi:transaldolase